MHELSCSVPGHICITPLPTSNKASPPSNNRPSQVQVSLLSPFVQLFSKNDVQLNMFRVGGSGAFFVFMVRRFSSRLPFEHLVCIDNVMLGHVARKPPSRYPLSKKLVQLLQTSSLSFWDEEKDPERQKQVTAAPDVAVFGSPVQSSRI